jgi:transketolase
MRVQYAPRTSDAVLIIHLGCCPENILGRTTVNMAITNTDTLCIRTLRFLCADMVQKANSGHPGMPMGMATIGYGLWTRALKYNPANPNWADRDRFVLSAGHGSTLQYALLHLTGFDLALEDLKQFRQWGSRTPGHPERGHTPGVECTTGPLGQGVANAVGMAIAEANLAARYNKPGHTVVDHRTYVIAGDGDLMEGMTYEACSLAGHLGLGKLTVLYDDNLISLSGSTVIALSEDIQKRFEAAGWRVDHLPDGDDLEAANHAIAAANAQCAKPTLLIARTHIGCGAPNKQDTYEAHGMPLGVEELAAAKKCSDWPVEPMFYIPEEARAVYHAMADKGKAAESAWQDGFRAYQKEYPELAGEFLRRMAGELPAGWDANLPTFAPSAKGIPTRKASEAVMQVLAERMPEFMGGSADLNPSAYTWLKGFGDFEAITKPEGKVQGSCGGPWGYDGRNIHFGVRELAMAAIVNGLEAHGGFISFGCTFLVFCDYMRPAIRLSALSQLGSIWVFSHDSIAVGEDGPTHQPVEHFAALRTIPGLTVLRPADAAEMVEAWRAAIARRDGPTAIMMTRQVVPILDRSRLAAASGLQRGAYVLAEAPNGKPDLLLLATGSEVPLALAAAEKLTVEGIHARVVSFPSWELFAEQDAAYRELVLPAGVHARLALEAGIGMGWERWVGERGAVLSIEGYGASAPFEVVYAKYGYTIDNVISRAKALL